MIIDIEKTWCFTGHRPNKLYGYDKDTFGNAKIRLLLRNEIINLYTNYKVRNFISGMAIGTDQWAAEQILDLKSQLPEIKLICAIPCLNQSDAWVKESRLNWEQIVDDADYVYHVSNKPYSDYCMQRRNEWMVNNSIGQIAVWDGSKGGTYNCINYANRTNKTNRIIIQPQTFKVFYNINA